jgi:ABC-type arginine transport system permease subunit
MITLFGYALMFACGALAKATDEISDGNFGAKWKKAGYALAAAYGATAGFLVAVSPELATLILAITAGVLFAGKIDSKQHQLGVAIIIAIVAIAGLPELNIALFVLFAALCILDEAFNDFVDRAKEKGRSLNWAPVRFLNARLSLEIGTIAIGLWSGNYGYFIAILLFDIAYNIVDRAMRAKQA